MPMPRINKNKAKGDNPAGTGIFEGSPKANTIHMRTAEAKNSEKKAETFVI